MSASMTARTRRKRSVQLAMIAAILGTGLIGAVPLRAEDADMFAHAGLSLEERLQLRCPPPDIQGSFATPAAVDPSPKMALWVSYTSGDDLVRLTREDLIEGVDLGDGDDVALLYDVPPDFSIKSGTGANTILLCSMAGLSASITLGSWRGRGLEANVVVVDQDIFSGVPFDLLRLIHIFEFDQEHDRLVIHAPEGLLAARQASIELRGLRIGNIVIRLHPQVDASPLRYDGHEEGAVLLNAAGQTGKLQESGELRD